MQFSKKHLPRLSLFYQQLFGILASILILVGLCIDYKGEHKIAVISILSAFIFIEFFLIIFSLLWGWNVPISIDCDGITIKKRNKKVKKHWDEVIEIKTFDVRWLGIYRAILVYSDSSKVIFETVSGIEHSIVSLCNNKEFLVRFVNALHIEDAIQESKKSKDK